jgi:hypothetical protein
MSDRARPVHVYCGPTIAPAAAREIVPGAVVHPPVRHGDLLSLELSRGDAVVIVDGVFHEFAPVRHKEILELLARGVTVVGAASMGALRAAELSAYGMIGIGRIFAAYRDGIIEADDEVAVVIAEAGDVRLSEALADIRLALRLAAEDGIISEHESGRLLEQARALPYPSRNWAALRAAAALADPELAAGADRVSRWRARHPGLAEAKLRDAQEALHLVAAGLPPAGIPAWSRGRWRNCHLQRWIASFSGADLDGVHVPFAAVLQHQQLYDPDFPRRWRQHVLSWISGTPGPAAEKAAAAAAEAAGSAPRHMSREQLGYWLTGDEVARLADREKLARILVRAVPQDRTAPVWPVTAGEASGLVSPAMDSARAAAAAFGRNAEISGSGPGRSIHQLRASQVREHLRRQWGIQPGDSPALTAAARDRGFSGIDTAVETARVFYLSAVRYAPADSGAAGAGRLRNAK